jgi:hypothetical protein
MYVQQEHALIFIVLITSCYNIKRKSEKMVVKIKKRTFVYLHSSEFVTLTIPVAVTTSPGTQLSTIQNNIEICHYDYCIK